MAETWPATIPQKTLAKDFSFSKGNNVIISQVDIGPAKKRRRYTDPIDTFAMSFDMTSAQYATFEAFYENTLLDGVLTFDQNHPITGVAGEFRIKEGYSTKHLGGDYFRVSMTWEKMP